MAELVVQFQLSDIPRILPELLLLVLSILVLGSDIFERWGSDEAARIERNRSSASLAALGLGMIFVIVLLQSGYVYQLPADAPENFFTNIIRNLQYGGAQAEPILGAFATDGMTMIGRLIFIGAAFLTILLTLDYQPSGNPGEFYTLILISTLGMCLMAGASELILAFIALELTSIPLYVLAGYFLNLRQSSEAGMKYFLFGALSSAILIYGMSMVYGYAATNVLETNTANDLTQFARIGQVASANIAQAEGAIPGLLLVGMLFIIAGLGYKLAVVPFHGWSPDVYQGAPPPITAFISTASKAAGFLLLFRVLSTAMQDAIGTPSLAQFGTAEGFSGWTSMLAILTLLTVIIGNLMALPQTNARRMLAYSSIAHAGFVLLGVLAWASPLDIDRNLGISALLYYLVVYSLTNIGAFGVLSVICMRVGGDDLRDLHGLAQRNLGLAILMAIFVLSLAGVPPLSGFFAKFYIFMAGWQSEAYWVVIVAIITTLIALYYYLRLLKAMFITPPESDAPVPTPPAINATLILAAVLVVALGVYPNLVLTVLEQVQTVAGM